MSQEFLGLRRDRIDVTANAVLRTLRLPLPWDEFDLPSPLQTSSTALVHGEIGWHWEPQSPSFPISPLPLVTGTAAPGWDLDHVVLLVPAIEAAVDVMEEIGQRPRLRMEVNNRPTVFYRVGPVLEIIESPVREPVVFGVALVTDEPLETVVLRWRALGRDVSDPKPAMQPGRRILTVRAVEAGLAVMSPERAV